MNKRLLFAPFFFLSMVVFSQQVIPLYPGAAPGSENWTYNEKTDSTNAPFHIVYNVSHPTLTAYLPDPAIATGTAIIVCPGGGFFVQVINEEGVYAANWLNKKGIAVFILKYRLGQSTTNNPWQELSAKMTQKDYGTQAAPIAMMAVNDGRKALAYVREHAASFGLAPNRIGIMGFSAGGTVAAAASIDYTPANRPDFVAPIYPFIPPNFGNPAPDAPPMFLAAATNDDLGLASHAVTLYSKWLAAKRPVELHMYEQGKHGFGMRKQDIPTDTWIDRFADWVGLQGLLTPVDSTVRIHLAQTARYNKNTEDNLHKDWPNIKRYDSANQTVPDPALGDKRVVFMGNSITDGWINADPTFFSSHPYIDRGISGQTTGQMLVRFREDVLNLKPAVVVILAGINDIAENNGPSKLADVFGNIASMAELAKAHHIKVVLSSVMPAFRFPWRLSIDPVPSVKALNEMIQHYAMQNGCVYLDYFTAMADSRRGLPENLSHDGVHPNLAGYKIMETLAVKAIDEAVKKK